MIRSTDTKIKDRKEFRAIRLENCRRKTVKRELRILNVQTVKITNLYARVESVCRCFSGQ